MIPQQPSNQTGEQPSPSPASHPASTQTVTLPSVTLPSTHQPSLSTPRSKPEEKKEDVTDSLRKSADSQVAGKPDCVAVVYDIRIIRGGRQQSVQVAAVTGLIPMPGLLESDFLGHAGDTSRTLLDTHVIRRVVHEFDRMIRLAGTEPVGVVPVHEEIADGDDDPRPQTGLLMPPPGG